MLFNRSYKLGLVITPRMMAMSFHKRNGKLIAQNMLEVPLDFKQLEKLDLSSCFKALTPNFSRKITRADVELRVALPDPCFEQSWLRFIDFPKGKKDAVELVKWRHCKELHLNEDEIELGFLKQSDPEERGGVSVLAQSASCGLIAPIKQALWDIGLVPHMIDGLGTWFSNGVSGGYEGQNLQFWQSDCHWAMQNQFNNMPADICYAAWRDPQGDAHVEGRVGRLLKIAEEKGAAINHLHLVGVGNMGVILDLAPLEHLGLKISRFEFADWLAVARMVAVS